MPAYCTAAEVRVAAAPDALDDVADAVLLQAADEASTVVDDFTGVWFGEQTRTLYARVNANGRAYLPMAPSVDYPVSITSVRFADVPDAEPLTTDHWQWTPAVDHKSESYIRVVGAHSITPDMTRRGREPWRLRNTRVNHRIERLVAIEGTFGTEIVPFAVAKATAMLSCWLLGVPLANEESTPLTGLNGLENVKRLSEEGFSIEFDRPTPATVGDRIPTTGVPQADRLLARYIRQHESFGLR